MGVEIYVCYHKLSPQPSGDVFRPIQVGKALSSINLPMLGDDVKDNISAKNPYFCELTATYWIWKNATADIVGLCHYRRYLNLKGRDTKFCSFSSDFAKTYGLTPENIEALLQRYDVLLPLPLPKRIHQDTPTVYEAYANSHEAKDMDCLLEVIGEKYPEMSEVAQVCLKQEKSTYMTNILIARRDVFNAYAKWLFDILFEVEARVHRDVLTRDAYQQRSYGFLAERMMKIFIEYHRRAQGLKIAEFPTLYFETDRKSWLNYLPKHFKYQMLRFFRKK